ncbi:hypothetical protein [Litoreibacter janthinus]|uniref:Uncharacterized protein n=1 Tax=Litoreibacter janthinus TaxID=670154 RepID=A0A1I6GF60_9RHOB|nr:hypothetical protein [Litoreibacter janthinus]SFR40845.1 hypothetical protein SAMN04488002_1380 [Litoreibacter janthinus]
MRALVVLMALAACGNQPNPPAASSARVTGISQFVADVSPSLSPEAQAIAASCGAQSATPEEMQVLSSVSRPLDAATTGMVSEIMTRETTLACLNANGVML